MAKKSTIVVRIILISVLAAFFVGVPLYTFLHLRGNMKWKPVSNLDGTRSRYAGLCFLPELENNIESVYIRGIRDADYKVVSKAYGSPEELFAILTYSGDTTIEECVGSMKETNVGSSISLPGAVSSYKVDILPLKELDSSTGKISPTTSFREYYVIQDGAGYRFVFIVHMT